MEFCRSQILALVALFLFPVAYGWGIDGHLITCRIAQVLDCPVLKGVYIFKCIFGCNFPFVAAKVEQSCSRCCGEFIASLCR